MRKSFEIADLDEPGERSYRQFHGWTQRLIVGGSVAFSLFILLYVSGVLSIFDIYYVSLTFNAIFLAFMVALVFILIPAKKGLSRNRMPWYDLLPILGIIISSTYIVINGTRLTESTVFLANTTEMVLGGVALVILVEAVRRSIGWPMAILLMVFLAHARWSYLLPEFPLSIREHDWSGILALSFLSSQGMYGELTRLSSHIIFVFIAFGVFFMKCGGGEFFLNLAIRLAGKYRGGPAKAAIFGSASFGTLSSSPLSNVVVTGSITIPLMKKTGYSPVFSAAVESVASTGGQIMPPVMGSIAFIMAALLGVSYATIAITAIIPAVIYFFALYIQTDLRAAKEGLQGVPASELPSFWGTMKGGWEFLIPFIFLVFLLFVMRYPAPLSASYSLAVLLIVSMPRKNHRFSLKKIVDALVASTRGVLVIAPAIAAAGVITGLIGMTGLGPKFAQGLLVLAGGQMLTLVILAWAASYVMGMGGAMIINYILLAVLIAPALLEIGVPLMASHFFIFYVGLSMFFTPPYCPVCFVASGIAKANTMQIGMQSVRLGMVAFIVPVMLMYKPALILMGTPLEIVEAGAMALGCALAMSIGVERYFLSKTNWPQTILAIAAGILFILPGLMSLIAAVSVGSVVIIWQLLTRKAALHVE